MPTAGRREYGEPNVPSHNVPIQQSGAVVNLLVRPVGDQGGGVPATGYLDTGASHTAVDCAILQVYGFTPSNGTTFHTPGSLGQHAKKYNVEIALLLNDSGRGDWLPLQVLGALLATSGCEVALGRDF